MLRQVLLGAALTLFAAGAFATEGVSEMAVRLFGKEEASKRVAEGALFVDGLYVKGPYSVTREGNVILVNGRVASRFKVEAKADAKAKADARAAQEDPAADGSGAVSEEDGASVGSDPTPTLGNDVKTAASGARPASAIEARLAQKGGGTLEERLAAKNKAKDAKAPAAGFNREPAGSDPLALFEEADYTYTPPSRPEPKAVPYIRPAAQKSMAQRMAEAKAKDAEIAARQAKPAAEAEKEEEGGDAIATESFDNLTEEEIAAYSQRFSKFRELIERSLAEDRLVLLSSANSGAKAEKRAVMRRFVASLEKLCAAPDASRLIAQWGTTLPRGYLSKIYDNRDANAREMRTLLLRVAREAKEERERAERRLR